MIIWIQLTLQRQFGHEQTLKEPGRRLAILEWPGWHLAVRGAKLWDHNLSLWCLYEKLLLVNSYQDLIGQPLFCLFPIGIGIGIGIEIIFHASL
jgi:hypothetical protein